jgi:holo-[acyl-carrier protein] synthase
VIIGSGVDVIEIARIERVLRRRGDRFERRVYTSREIEQCHRVALHGAVAERCQELAARLRGSSEGFEAPRGLQAHLAIGRSRTHAVTTVLLEDPEW